MVISAYYPIIDYTDITTPILDYTDICGSTLLGFDEDNQPIFGSPITGGLPIYGSPIGGDPIYDYSTPTYGSPYTGGDPIYGNVRTGGDPIYGSPIGGDPIYGSPITYTSVTLDRPLGIFGQSGITDNFGRVKVWGAWEDHGRWNQGSPLEQP